MASTSLAPNFAALNLPIIARGQRSSSPHEFPKTSSYFPHHQVKHHQYHRLPATCKATSSSSSLSWSITEYDLYDLLGIDSSSDQSEIKRAYRSLQKRCHPDIAGTEGHDMAIILNEAYSVLSDPISRHVYDKEQAKLAELRGFTGRPLYSVWEGSETEQRAIFVDEVRCVGCLKCALLADKTFAIESAFGRARVVSQWADPEDKIQAAIDACPVSCIWTVERSDLAALEFLMSKQPRGKVRVGTSNTGGVRTFDVFSELKFFNKRLEEAAARKSNQESKFSELENEARTSAIQTIRSISNWLYWRLPGSDVSLSLAPRKNNNIGRDPVIDRLREAAAAWKLKSQNNAKLLPKETFKDEYWVPLTPDIPQKSENKLYSRAEETPSTTKDTYKDSWGRTRVKRKVTKSGDPIVSGIPFGLGVAASIIIGLQGSGEAVGRVEGHIGGSFALQLVNSFGLQVMLAGITWYLIGVYIAQVVEMLAGRNKM